MPHSRSTDLQSPELPAQEVAAMFITLDGLGVAQINLGLNVLHNFKSHSIIVKWKICFFSKPLSEFLGIPSDL